VSPDPRVTKPLAPLTLAALGVVYGDIGTSPLYAAKERSIPTTGLRSLRRTFHCDWSPIPPTPRSTAPRRPHSSIPVSDILTIASSDRLVQQSNGVITREVEATHRLRRGIIVTSDDCIAIEADEVFVLRVHRRSATLFLPSMF
jgi:K+ potassium transporter